MDKLAWLLKEQKYERLEYSFDVPPLCTDRWSKSDWINYIDSHGRWHGQCKWEDTPDG